MAKKKESFIGDLALAGAVIAGLIYGVTQVKKQFSSKPLEQRVEQAILSPEIEVPEVVKAYIPTAPDYSIRKDVKTGLAVVENRDSFQFYGSRVQKSGKYRQVDADLYDLLMNMADSYKAEFSQKLFIGPMWDDQGHSKNSKHYEGKAVDIDFGANIGTLDYKTDRPKAEFLLRYIQKYAKEHNKEFKVLFNDRELIKEGLCTYFEGHHNHIHIGK
jgi:hypothetical protein